MKYIFIFLVLVLMLMVFVFIKVYKMVFVEVLVEEIVLEESIFGFDLDKIKKELFVILVKWVYLKENIDGKLVGFFVRKYDSYI